MKLFTRLRDSQPIILRILVFSADKYDCGVNPGGVEEGFDENATNVEERISDGRQNAGAQGQRSKKSKIM